MKRGRQYTSEFYRGLKDIVERELRENPHVRFSYYSLGQHISRIHSPVGSYCVQTRIMKLVDEDKCRVVTDPIKKTRKQIIWIGDK